MPDTSASSPASASLPSDTTPTCVDINEQRVNQLANASSPIHEPGLEPLLRQLLDNRQINFTTDAANALANSNIVVIAVGSPSLPNGRADISQAIKAIETVATNASPNSTIIVKSTLPIGVYPRIEEILAAKAPTLSVVFNPEFLREGHGLYDFYHPERVVVGSNSPTALATIRKLYQPLLDASYKLPEELNITPKQTIPYIETDATTAQMIKYASNVFLATRVSFINELASICESVNADVKTVTTGLGLDSRIGSSYTQPGPGFGGPCLEKDLSALIEIAEMNHASPAFFKAVLERNRFRLREIKRDIDSLCGGELIGKNIVIWGIAFKAGTNDARTSISIRLATLLGRPKRQRPRPRPPRNRRRPPSTRTTRCTLLRPLRIGPRRRYHRLNERRPRLQRPGLKTYCLSHPPIPSSTTPATASLPNRSPRT